MKFGLGGYGGATIFDADLWLSNWHSGTCAARVTNIRRLTETYDNNTVTWANQPTSTSTGGSSANESHGNEALGCADAAIRYDMTQTVRNRTGAAGSTADWPNYGVSVWAGNETGPSAYKAFRSNQYGTLWPKMVIDYDNAPDVPVLDAPNQFFRFTYSPTLSAAYSDKDGDPGKVTFTIQDRAGATVRTVTSAQVNSGQTATVDLSVDPLPAGWYVWSATDSDGRMFSAPSGTRQFETSPASAATPGIGAKPSYTFQDLTLADRVQAWVNVANGNLLLRQKELVIRGTAGHDLSLERLYNSQRRVERELGLGWSLGPAQQVGLYHGPGNGGKDFVYEDEYQTRWSLRWNATSGTWDMPAGLNARLTADTDYRSHYELKFNKSRRELLFTEAGLLSLSPDPPRDVAVGVWVGVRMPFWLRRWDLSRVPVVEQKGICGMESLTPPRAWSRCSVIRMWCRSGGWRRCSRWRSGAGCPSWSLNT